MGGAAAMRFLPRRGPDPLNRPWRDVEYAVVDLETTGLDLRRDCIASYGIAVVRHGRIVVAENVYGLVRPDCALSPESITVHALRPVDLTEAPPVSDAVEVIEKAVTGRVVVAHAAWIEESFLGRAFADSGKKFRCSVIDTAAMARAAGWDTAARRGEPNLEWLSTELNLPVFSPHHALGDASTTAQVFLALACRLESRGYARARDLVDLTSTDRILRR